MHMINGTMPHNSPVVPGGGCDCNGHSNGKGNGAPVTQGAWVWIALAFMLGSLVTRK